MSFTTCLVVACATLLPQGQPPKGPPKTPTTPTKEQGQDKTPRPQYVFKPMAIPRAIVEHRKKTEIRVDGSLGDWPKVAPISLRDPRQVSGTALLAYHGVNDISGQLYMVWDEQDLYIAIQILDDWHRPLKKEMNLRQEIPPVDNVLITFDPDRNTRTLGDDPGRRDDRTFYFADLEEVGDKLILWDRRKATKNLTKGAKCVVDRREQEGVTIFEARIPWPQILPPGKSPEANLVMDMQVVINDYDEFTDPMPQTRVGWNFGMGPQIKPGLFGSIMLLKDFDAEKQQMPEFALPTAGWTNEPERKYWVDLYQKIRETSPSFVSVHTPDPAMVGGAARYKLLTDLEGYLRSFRRLDNLEYHHRIQRRMNRETSGIAETGLPFFWDYAVGDVLRRAVAAPEAGGIRVFRLPQGGWYIRSDTTNFVIDPCGLGIEKLYLKGGIDFALLTRPSEVTRRHDPLLVRMAASKPKRQFFTHMEFHLPAAKPGSMSLVKPFTDYLMGGLEKIVPIGVVTADGSTSISVGYLVRWKDGRTLVAAGLSVTEALIEKLGVKPDVLILSALHGLNAAKLAKAFGAKHTLLDDVLVAEEYPAWLGGRVTYPNALKLQNELKPVRTLILAPGESIDLTR